MKQAVKALLVAIIVALGATSAEAANIERLRVGEHPTFTRLVFELGGTADYQVFALDGPNRIVVDLRAGGWATPRMEGAAKLVAGWRYGARGDGAVRAVFDMARPAKVTKAFTLDAEGGKPHRLVIDLQPVSAPVFSNQIGRVIAAHGDWAPRRTVSATTSAAVTRPAARPASRPAAQPPRALVQQAAATAPARRVTPRADAPVIVLDAGHGGVDPGAISPNGVYEKTITLAMARELRAMIEATGRYRVVMTRDDDRFIPLRERVAIARRAQADLFLSIHADSINSPSLKGFSIYTLSDKASDAEAAALARRENKADLIGGVAEQSFDDAQVANILLDLSMRQTRRESLMLASGIVDSMRGQVRLLNKPQRAAGFAVLKAPDVPSALVELGFLSNAAEAQLLTDPGHRKTLGRGLMRGIEAFFANLNAMRRT